MPEGAGFFSRQALMGYGVALAIVVLDQWTKHLASLELSYRVPVELTSWFDLTLAHNTGAAFSFWQGRAVGSGGFSRQWRRRLVWFLLSGYHDCRNIESPWPWHWG